MEINVETCQLCGQHADWDTSIGTEYFIVCKECYDSIPKDTGLKKIDVFKIIIAMGTIRKEFLKKTCNEK